MHRDRSLVVLDNAVGDGKTKTCPRSHLLGGEERIEDALLESCRDARAAIFHLQLHDVHLHHTGDGDHLAWHACQCIACIGEQIDEDLFQLDGVAPHNHLVCREVHLHLDLPQTQLFGHQRERTLTGTPQSTCIIVSSTNITGNFASRGSGEAAKPALSGYRSDGRSLSEGHPEQDWQARPVASRHGMWYGYRWSKGSAFQCEWSRRHDLIR